MNKILTIPEQKTPYFTMSEVTITTESDLSSLKESFRESDLSHFLFLHSLKDSSPKRGLRETKEFLSKYPHHPDVMNLMSYFYLARRKVKKADSLTLENYRYNPDHLIVKLNYADFCIRKKRVEEVPHIFHNQVDLSLILPSRKTFHLTEYRGFMTTMGFYHLALKNKEAAESYFYLAYTVDRSHPSVQLLKKKLYRKRRFQKNRALK
jgi:hypothetical protein